MYGVSYGRGPGLGHGHRQLYGITGDTYFGPGGNYYMFKCLKSFLQLKIL